MKKIDGSTWVGIWSVYVMVMLTLAFRLNREINPWVGLLTVVLSGYTINSTAKIIRPPQPESEDK